MQLLGIIMGCLWLDVFLLTHSFFIYFVSVDLNAICEDLSLTVILLVDISFALIGAADDPVMTTRLDISPTPPAGFFSPVLDVTMLGIWLVSTFIFFFSKIYATAARRGSFIEVAGAVT